MFTFRVKEEGLYLDTNVTEGQNFIRDKLNKTVMSLGSILHGWMLYRTFCPPRWNLCSPET
jgi:hypothetical protein